MMNTRFDELLPFYVNGTLAEADREQRSLLEVSVGMGLAFFNSARKVGRQHVLDPTGRHNLTRAFEPPPGSRCRVAGDDHQPSVPGGGLQRPV